MDSLATPPSIPGERDRAGGSRLRALLREPLAHFLALGALLFAVSAISARRVERARVIEVPPEQLALMADQAKTALGHAPSEAEMAPAYNDWLSGELLYREALALGLDKNDPGIRARMVSKMRAVLQQQVDPGRPTEAQARAWFDANHGQFDTPAQIDFIAVRFDGADAEKRARQALSEIQTGREPEAVRNLARIYQHRPQASLDVPFGRGFLAQLLAAKRETWSVAHAASAGTDGVTKEVWYVVRVDGVHAAETATWEQARDASVEGWKQDEIKRQSRAMMDALKSRYVIRWPGR